ncbi:MAG: hypothetical protein K6E51_11950 [Treponema sp.]|nr:hypothetical protein [Treponema sp.]
MEIHEKHHTVVFLCLLVCVSLVCNGLCYAKGGSDQDTVDSESETLIVPAKKVSTSFFYDVPEDILQLVFDGSPSALREAAAGIRKASVDYSEREKILLSVMTGIMTVAWSPEKPDWESPAVSEANLYTGALDSVRKGIYDSSTGQSDFLTLVLPSLVLLTNTSRTDFYNDSEKALLLAKNIKPASLLVTYLLGILYRKMGRMDESTEYLKEAVSLDGNCMQPSYALACNLQETDAATAFSLITAQVKKYPDNNDLLKLGAELSYRLGDYNTSELYVAKVLQQNPNDPAYILFRAKILIEKGDYIRAASLLDVYERTDGTARDYLLLRARIQRDWNKNMSAAVDTMSKAVSLYPEDMEVLLYAAQTAASAGAAVNNMTAAALALKVLDADPSNSGALNIYVQQLAASNKWTEAYEASSKLLAKEPVAASVIFTHIKICLAIKKTDEAWKLISGMYEKNPNDEETVQSYIDVLYAMGRRAETLSIINNLLQTASPRMKSFLYFKRSFLQNGEQAVLADLRSSLIANPRNTDALYQLYVVYYTKKDWRKAQYYLKQVVALSASNEELIKKNEELDRLLGR